MIRSWWLIAKALEVKRQGTVLGIHLLYDVRLIDHLETLGTVSSFVKYRLHRVWKVASGDAKWVKSRMYWKLCLAGDIAGKWVSMQICLLLPWLGYSSTDGRGMFNYKWDCEEHLGGLTGLSSSFIFRVVSSCLVLDLPSHRHWDYLLNVDEKRVNEVPWGVEVQGTLALLHFPDHEVFQFLCILDDLLLWSRQVLHHWMEHVIELGVGEKGWERELLVAMPNGKGTCLRQCFLAQGILY